MRHTFTAAAVAALVLAAGSARAAPPSLSTARASGGAAASESALNPFFNYPGQHQNFSDVTSGSAGVNLAPVDGAASAGSLATTNQFVEVNANATGSVFSANIFSASAYAESIYSFAVYGPDNIDVTIVLQGRVEATVTDFGSGADVYAQTAFDVSGLAVPLSGPQAVSMFCEHTDSTGQCGTRDFTTVLTIKSFTDTLAGGVGTIDLAVSAGAQGRSLGFNAPYAVNGGVARATADPFFSIDPTFALEHPGYRLVFSDGFSNGALPGQSDAVPEPASWALMIAGFGLAGAALRRRAAAVFA
jgi:hypothetical protein